METVGRCILIAMFQLAPTCVYQAIVRDLHEAQVKILGYCEAPRDATIIEIPKLQGHTDRSFCGYFMDESFSKANCSGLQHTLKVAIVCSMALVMA